MDRGGLSRGRERSWPRPGCCRASPTKADIGPPSPERGGARHAAPRDRARGLSAGRRGRDLARHRRVGIRQQTAAIASASRARARQRRMIELLGAGSTATQSCRSKTRWPRTIRGAARASRTGGAGSQVVGDDFLVTNAARVAPRPRTAPATRCSSSRTRRARSARPRRPSTPHSPPAGAPSSRPAPARPRMSHRPSRRRLGRAAAQGRLLRALRADGEMERGAAHRRSAGRKRRAAAGERAALAAMKARRCSIASFDQNSRPMRRWSSDQGPPPWTTKNSAATAHKNGYSKPSVFQK